MTTPPLPEPWSKLRRRGEFAGCTYAMLTVMHRLAVAADSNWPFIHLPDVHRRTLNSLVQRDWAVRSPGRDGVRYKLTGRGRAALETYAVPTEVYDTRRWDGLCPDCGKREKVKAPNGKTYGYCEHCLSIRHAKKSSSKNPGLCPSCKTRQKHITASGKVRSYCKPCRRQHSKAYRKRYNAEIKRRIEQEGYIKYCSSCHEKPVYITGNTVTDYCYECYRKQQNRHYHRTHNADIYPSRKAQS